MDKFILESGKIVAKWRSGINDFLKGKIEGNPTNLIPFLLTFFIFIILTLRLFFSFSLITYNYLIFLFLFIGLGLVMIWVAIFYEFPKHLEASRNCVNLDKESKQQFFKLLKGIKVQKKINFTKSGDSAIDQILLIFFEELPVGGIQNLTKDRERDFFRLVMNSLLVKISGCMEK